MAPSNGVIFVCRVSIRLSVSMRHSTCCTCRMEFGPGRSAYHRMLVSCLCPRIHINPV